MKTLNSIEVRAVAGGMEMIIAGVDVEEYVLPALGGLVAGTMIAIIYGTVAGFSKGAFITGAIVGAATTWDLSVDPEKFKSLSL